MADMDLVEKLSWCVAGGTLMKDDEPMILTSQKHERTSKSPALYEMTCQHGGFMHSLYMGQPDAVRAEAMLVTLGDNMSVEDWRTACDETIDRAAKCLSKIKVTAHSEAYLKVEAEGCATNFFVPRGGNESRDRALQLLGQCAMRESDFQQKLNGMSGTATFKTPAQQILHAACDGNVVDMVRCGGMLANGGKACCEHLAQKSMEMRAEKVQTKAPAAPKRTLIAKGEAIAAKAGAEQSQQLGA